MAINQLPNLPDAPALGTPAPIFSSMMFSLYAGIKNLVPALNTVTEQIDQASANVNTKEASTVEASSLAASARDEAVIARDEAVGAVATLPDGIINDAIISTTDTWSSSKVAAEIAAGQSIETITMTKDHEADLTLPTGENVASIYRYGNRDVFITTNGYIAVYDIATKTFGAFTLARDAVASRYIKYDEDTLIIAQGTVNTAIIYLTVVKFTGTTVNVGTKYSFTFPASVQSPIKDVFKVGSSVVVATSYTSSGTTNNYLVAATLSGSVVTFGAAYTITGASALRTEIAVSGNTMALFYYSAGSTMKAEVVTLSGVTFTAVGSNTSSAGASTYYALPFIHNGFAIIANNDRVHYVKLADGTGGVITGLPTLNTTPTAYLKNGNSVAILLSDNLHHFTVSTTSVTYNAVYGGLVTSSLLVLSESKIVSPNLPTIFTAEIDSIGNLSVRKTFAPKAVIGTGSPVASSPYSIYRVVDFGLMMKINVLYKNNRYLNKNNRPLNAVQYLFDGTTYLPYLFDRDYKVVPLEYSDDCFWEILQGEYVGSSLVNFKRYI